MHSLRSEWGRNWGVVYSKATYFHGPLSPTSFITYLDGVVDGLWDNGTGISVHGIQLNNLRFADDIDVMEERRDMLQANINTLHTAEEAAGLRINNGRRRLTIEILMMPMSLSITAAYSLRPMIVERRLGKKIAKALDSRCHGC